MIEVKNLCKTYISNKKSSTKALSNINLTLPDNGMIFITGQTGSGKTTLLNMIGLIDSYDSGEIILFDKSYNNLSEKEKDSIRRNNIGFVFQDYNLIPDLSVYENLCLVYKILNKEVNNQEIDYYLNLFEMNETKNKYINELSGGQKQRISIIRAIIKKPNIILADEPTSALDDDTSEVIFKKLQEISKDTLVLIVSHNQKLSEKYADRIIEIKKGEIVSDNSINELYYKNNHLDYIDNKFSFKELLKLAKNKFSYNVKHLIILLLMIILSLTITLTFLSPLTIKMSSVMANATYVNNQNYLVVGANLKKIKTRYGFSYGFSREKYSKLFDDIESNYYLISSKYYNSFSDIQTVFNTSPNISGGIFYTENVLSDLNTKVLIGEEIKGNNEILISDLLAHTLAYSKFEGANEMSDLIGKTLYLNSNNYLIKGIFQSHVDLELFDFDKYIFLPYEEKDSIHKIWDREINDYGLASMVFVKDEVYWNQNESIYFDLYLDDLTTKSFSKYDSDIDSYVKENINLNPNSYEIVLSKDAISELVESRTLELVLDYAKENYTVMSSNPQDYEKYYEYIISIKNYNKYDEEKTYKYFENKATEIVTKEIVGKQYDLSCKDMFSTIGGLIDFDIKVKVIGITNYWDSLVSDSLYDYLCEELYISDFRYTLLYFNKSLKERKSILKSIYSENDLSVYSEYNDQVDIIEDIFNLLKPIFIALSIVMFSIVILIYMFYRYNIVNMNRIEIGILKSLGLNQKYINYIYYIIDFIIMIITIIASNIILNIIYVVLNEKVITYLDINVPVFSYDFIMILISVLFFVIISFIASLKSNKKLKKISIAQIINENKASE